MKIGQEKEESNGQYDYQLSKNYDDDCFKYLEDNSNYNTLKQKKNER